MNLADFKSSSSFGQDKFVLKVLDMTQGLFLDMGSGLPIETSNSYGLEQIGWTGWRCDIKEFGGERYSLFYHGDGATFPLRVLPGVVDYLSMDVDGSWEKVLRHLLSERHMFRVITIEHDAYAGGYAEDKDAREKQRGLLTAAGYHLVCGDVHWHQGPIEDWWVHPRFVRPESYESLHYMDKNWEEIV